MFAITTKKLALQLTAILTATLIATSVPTTAFAGIADNGGWWQTWSGLYLGTLEETGDGNLQVQFLNGSGQVFTNWTYPDNATCAGKEWLVLSSSHPQREGLIKALMAAGLSQRRVFVLLQPVGDTCYLKRLRVEFRRPV